MIVALSRGPFISPIMTVSYQYLLKREVLLATRGFPRCGLVPMLSFRGVVLKITLGEAKSGRDSW